MGLLTRSYLVFYVGLIAHLLQLLFLGLVENPHVERIYGSTSNGPDESSKKRMLYNAPLVYFGRDLVLFKNLDPFRAADLFLLIIIAYTLTCYFIPFPKGYFVFQTICWRLIHTYGLGWILYKQGQTRFWTRHFIKFGGTKQEAFAQWKSLYNMTLVMSYVTFVLCALKYWVPIKDTNMDLLILNYVLGCLLVLLHVWTSLSTYKILEDFGWFYGDFFIKEYKFSLNYTGIYRFLNNPENLMGGASLFGLALMSRSWTVFRLAIFAQLSNLWFSECIETPHMKKIYGPMVRKESGIERAIMKNIEPLGMLHDVRRLILNAMDPKHWIGENRYDRIVSRSVRKQVKQV